MNTNTLDPVARPEAAPSRFFGGRVHRNAVLLAGGLVIACLGVAAGLAWHPSSTLDTMPPPSAVPAKSSLASNEAIVEPSSSTANKVGTPVPAAGPETMNDGGPAASAQAPVAGPATSDSHSPVPTQARPAPRQATPSRPAGNTSTPVNASGSSGNQVAAAVCGHCGVVESVHEVRVKGKGSGVGAVAGGVLGGAVGNQMGHGNGRAAMTILGAIGGGLAGNEIEKRTKAETFYDVTVRLDDGRVRTIRQKTAPATGTRVTIDKNVVHVAPRNA
jgi:outer membrane lipoprotein SlyB